MVWKFGYVEEYGSRLWDGLHGRVAWWCNSSFKVVFI